jgi:DNA-binding CsgD family transcriptional regulator
MAHMDPDVLVPVATRLLARRGSYLSPAERSELLRIAQGYACKDSAAAAGVCYETIRARRKRIYRKLSLGSSGELISCLLEVSLGMLATGEALRNDDGVGEWASQPAAAAGAQRTSLPSA